MTKKLKKQIRRVALGGIMFVIAYIINRVMGIGEVLEGEKTYIFSVFARLLSGEVIEGVVTMPLFLLMFVLFVTAYIIIGIDVLQKAIVNMSHLQFTDENFLMFIATGGALVIMQFDEAVAVMLFYQVGEIFQKYAVNNSRGNIAALMNIRPDYAHVVREGGETETVDPGKVNVGDIIMIKPGERVPLDGVVTKGNSSLDTMALTGESMPREIKEGDEIISGCINIHGVIEAKVTSAFGDSTVARILDLVENASSRKAEAENFISKFAKYYTPVVVVAALALAIIPSLVIPGADVHEWIYRGLTFLVVSCPCALVISIPLSFFGGIGGASELGVLVKGSNYLEALAQAKTLVMDKTGTLTKGNFKVTDVVLNKEAGSVTREKVLETAALAESFSTHPIALSLMEGYKASVAEGTAREDKPDDVEEIAGRGIRCKLDGAVVLAGNDKLLKEQEVTIPESFGDDAGEAAKRGTLVYVARDGVFLGYIVISDEIKPDAAKAIKKLYGDGVDRIVMLTGDRKDAAESIANELGIKEFHAELLPADKVNWVEKILEETKGKGNLIFVGDGINDAPVISRADIGVAMGALGSQAAIEAADVVLMDDNPLRLHSAIRVSRKTLAIVKQNTWFAIAVKILVLLITAFIAANMWAAIFADVGVTVIAVLNAMRCLNVKELKGDCKC